MTETIASRDRLTDAVEQLELRIDEGQRRLSGGHVVEERVPAAVYSLAKTNDALARTLALLGEGDRAREAYAEAAVYYRSAIHESKRRRDMFRPRERYDDPRTCIRAIERGLLSGQFHLAESAAHETLSMGQQFLIEHDTAPHYAAKLLAAVVLDDDDRRTRYAEEYRNAVGDRMDPVDEHRLFVYEGIAERDAVRTAEGLRGMLEERGQFAGEDDADVPGRPVDDWLAALCLLAREKGLDVTVEADTVPSVLLPEAGASTSVVTREDHEGWLPDVHRDAGGEGFVLVEEVEYPDRGPLTADDLPEVDGDRVLSKGWVDAAIERLRETGEEDHVERADELEAAHRSRDLRRRLVVRPGGTEREDYRIDGSVYKLGIDEVEVRDAE